MATLNKSGQLHSKAANGDVLKLYPNTLIANVDGLQSALDGKVNTVSGKGLSTNDYTTAEKNKLAGIATGATANIGTVTQVKVGSTAYNPSSGVVSLPAYPTTLPASDVSSWAKASSKPSYTASEVGAIATTAKGAASGVAELDANGKVPSSQLPSYVDDVLEYTAKSSFPMTGETGKIYVDTTTNLTYRWSGSAYVEISPSLALGTTSSTAYRGDYGNTAYSHATDSSRLTTAQSSGLYKIATTAQGHIASVTAVAKSDITGLGIPGSDTNTHRPIQVNGTQVLGDNTTALNLKAGSNVSISNSSGTVTIAATDTTYSAATQSAAGLMSASDKTKLDGIASGAQVNSITGVKGNSESSYRTGNVNLTAANVGAAASSHTHGNIQNGGTLQTNDITIASGDKLVVTDSSDSSKIARTSISFDGSTTTQALTKAGSWQTFNNYSHPTSAGNKHIPSGGSSGQILTYGGSSGTASWGNLPTIDTVLNGGSTNAVQNKVVTSAIVHTMDNGVKNLCPYSTFNMSGSGWTEIFSGYEEFPAGDYAIQVVYTSSATAQFGIVYTDGTSLNLTPVLSAATNTKIALGINATKPFKKIQIYHNAAITMNDVLFCKWDDFSISTAYNTPRVDPSVLIPMVYPSFKQPTKHSSITSIDSGGYIQIGKLVIVNMKFTVGSAISQYADLFTGLPAPLGNSAYVACASNTNTIMISSDGSMSNYAQGSLAAGMVVVSAVYMAQ